LSDFSLAAFGTIALTIFVAELTDKDAFLLIALSTRVKARLVFMAGAVAFVFTTTVIIALGSALIVVVPVYWVRLAGGLVMIAYGLWEARGLVGVEAVSEEESRIEKAQSAWKTFAAMVAGLALLDLAGDATEVLTIVFVARFPNPLFVFAAAILALISATAVETALGSRLSRILTPRRLRTLSLAVFLLLGATIIIFNSG
jgi:putative Ca2+/H+ antiporter (TMEM165/GDT1 family)